MRLNKVNKNGSLSIILPKELINDLGLKERQLIELLGTSKNSVVFSINEVEKQSVQDVLKELQTLLESFKKLLNNMPKELQMDDEVVKNLLKQRILGILEII